MRGLGVSLLTFYLACHLDATPAVATPAQNDPLDGGTYDYIVVGAGVSGLVVANRLTENPNTTVLVIERGYFDDKPEAIVPWYANGLDTSVMIRPRSAPNLKLNNSTYLVAVAAVVGGGSVVNGMGFIRGSKADYDAWEELGNPGWGWDSLLPYFRKSTTFDPPSPEVAARWNITWDPSVYGNGPVHVHISNFQYPDVEVVWDALRNQPGLPLLPSTNAGYGPGASWSPLSIDARTMTRTTARSAYYDPVNATRSNLRLITGQTAIKILFGHGRPLTAKGVRIVSRLDSAVRNVYARKEVILAAGAIQTPQLLQASGIGPAAVLRAVGVEVKKDLASVGANLQDHPTTFLLFSLSNQSFPNPDTIANNATYNATVWAEYLANKTGPISTGNGNTIACWSLSHLNSSAAASSLAARLLAQDARLYLPEIYRTSPSLLRGFLAQRAVLANRFTSSDSSIACQPLSGNGASPAILLKPLSRGSVTLNASDPLGGLPVVQYNTLQNPLDGENVVSIVRRARRLWAGPEMGRLGPSEISPGPQHQSDAEILEALTGNPSAFWPSLAHPSGTCAMMPERLGGCVDADLRVYGVEGLRVVDASVMPLIVGTALQATVYAVAEKAADLIKARADEA
ncbi:Glucose-methanol-choline oxidoreductase N-terminal domain-containing protein [Madurella fahalii]|uniref:Glucose-methanol-choline oxidoreductase N-terminal domain-containing protein n=1 Tax=Madurella fahalii TaxID=1157608 RepID=A0ABQ0GPW3_9PEZI